MYLRVVLVNNATGKNHSIIKKAKILLLRQPPVISSLENQLLWRLSGLLWVFLSPKMCDGNSKKQSLSGEYSYKRRSINRKLYNTVYLNSPEAVS